MLPIPEKWTYSSKYLVGSAWKEISDLLAVLLLSSYPLHFLGGNALRGSRCPGVWFCKGYSSSTCECFSGSWAEDSTCCMPFEGPMCYHRCNIVYGSCWDMLWSGRCFISSWKGSLWIGSVSKWNVLLLRFFGSSLSPRNIKWMSFGGGLDNWRLFLSSVLCRTCGSTFLTPFTLGDCALHWKPQIQRALPQGLERSKFQKVFWTTLDILPRLL